MKIVKSYVSEDGALFESADDCLRHEVKEEFKALLREYRQNENLAMGANGGLGTFYSGRVLHFALKNEDFFQKLFDRRSAFSKDY